MSIATRLTPAFLCAVLAYSQNPTFEVASVKPAPPPNGKALPRSIRGGPGSTDPGAIAFQNVDLLSIVTLAYDIKPYQVAGPDWLATTRYDITAKLPPGVTTEQYRAMLRNLLADRFLLTAHRNQKEGPVYDLAIARNGPKLTESPDDPTVISDGSLQPPPLASSPPPGYAGRLAIQLRRCNMELLAAFLTGHVGLPVRDATGLTGRYDVKLSYTLAGLRPGMPSETPSDSENSVFNVLETNLGLKLVSKKGTIDQLVIDRIEKVPTEN